MLIDDAGRPLLQKSLKKKRSAVAERTSSEKPAPPIVQHGGASSTQNDRIGARNKSRSVEMPEVLSGIAGAQNKMYQGAQPRTGEKRGDWEKRMAETMKKIKDLAKT